MVFLYKVKNSTDRDCVNYIRAYAKEFSCGHYFSGINLQGSCFSNSLSKIKEESYENIITILTEEEIDKLIKFDNDINALGYGIKEADDRYIKGIALCDDIKPIFDKLNSKENMELYEDVKKQEREYIKEKHNLSDNDVDKIFDQYGLEYRDRSVIAYVYSNKYELTHEETASLGYVSENYQSRYFDYESFGDDLLEQEDYIELDNGRIANLMY